MKDLKEKLKFLYGDKADYAYEKLAQMMREHTTGNISPAFLTEKDALVETYGDTLQSGDKHTLAVMNDFLQKYTKDAVTCLKLCPHYPYTSDDGYSVADYYNVDPTMGDWSDVQRLGGNYRLLVELVLNHTSKSNEWFKKFLACDEKYRDFYLTGDPNEDHSSVIRPRVLPLFAAFETAEGTKQVWTTFSDDQVDLNFRNPDVLIAFLEIIMFYVKNGARIIGMDAVGFIWKEKGTGCMHLEQTHEILKVMRIVVDACVPGTLIITETNVPHEDNISYFGESDESHLVYQFVLPPLTLHTYLTQSAAKLTEWATGLEPPLPNTAFYNFLASHDGIGLRPVEGILSEDETNALVDAAKNHGGFVNYRYLEDGSQRAYELNINYMDALSTLEDNDELRAKRMLGAHSIIMSLQGIPSIYIHSLIGSRNWREGVLSSGINRRINREKIDVKRVEQDIADGTIRKTVLEGICHMLKVRGKNKAFAPETPQKILNLGSALFAVLRTNENQSVVSVTNASLSQVSCSLPFAGDDLLTGKSFAADCTLEPLETVWIVKS